MSYGNYRIVKYTEAVTKTIKYKVQCDVPPVNQGIVGPAQFMAGRPILTWHTVDIVSDIDLARNLIRQHKEGLLPGEEIVT